MTTKYDLACRLVEKHVLTCVSSLIPALYEVATNGDHDDIEAYQGELANLVCSADYEEPVCNFIRDDADLDQLEEIVEERGDWEDLLANIGFRQDDLDEACTAADEAVDDAWQDYLAEEEFIDVKFNDDPAAKSELASKSRRGKGSRIDTGHVSVSNGDENELDIMFEE